MALSTILVPLFAAVFGLGGALGGAMVTQRSADRRARLEHEREDVRWSQERDREKAAWAREDAARSYERTQQRLADSYLEVLRLVEREAQWFEASTKNWKVGAINYDHHDLQLPHVELPERKTSDRATIAAHLAAYGSKNVRKLHQTWRATITSIENVHESWDQNWALNGEPPSVEQVDNVWTSLYPDERVAREALGDAIADELGHRSDQHCD